MAAFLPGTWSDDVSKYLPAQAGMAVTAVRPDSSSLAPWAGIGVLCLYTAVVLALGALRMQHRDA